jgi:hypothetical protein
MNTEELYNFFQEAIHHSRRETTMKCFLRSLDLELFKTSSFDEIFWYVWRKRPAGINKLGVYDISSKIYRHYGGTIDVVYLVGNGPINRIKELGLSNKIKKRRVKKLQLDYVEISDVLSKVPNYQGQTNDGDALESFLCVMHKV